MTTKYGAVDVREVTLLSTLLEPGPIETHDVSVLKVITRPFVPNDVSITRDEFDGMRPTKRDVAYSLNTPD